MRTAMDICSRHVHYIQPTLPIQPADAGASIHQVGAILVEEVQEEGDTREVA